MARRKLEYQGLDLQSDRDGCEYRDWSRSSGATGSANGQFAECGKGPVSMLKCGDRHMEANLYKAMKAPEPPAESFIAAAFERLPDISDTPETVEISGRLTIAGLSARSP